MRYLPAVLLLALLPALAQAQTTAVRPSQIVPGTPDITVNVPAGSNNVVIGSTVTWRQDTTTTPTICTGSGTGSGSGAASCTASDMAKVLELTNAGAITATLPSLSDGASFTIQLAGGTLALSPPASASINGSTAAITVGAYQSVALSSRNGNWYAALSVPQPTAQAGSTYLADNMKWATPSGTGPAGIAHVRDFSATATSSGTTVTFTLGTAIGSGNSIVGVLAFHNSTNDITSIAAGSNTLTTFDYILYSTGTYSAIGFALHGVTGSPTTITVTFSGTPAGTDHYLGYGEYSGGSAAGAQHTYGYSTTAVTSLSTNSVTTTANGAWLWTGYLGAATATTPTGGWTRRLSDATNQINSADLSQTSAGAISATWTFASASGVLATIISISP